MRIALVSSFVPFIDGGYRNIVDWLQVMLEAEGHQIEKIYLPEVDTPDLLFQQMMAFRWIDLDAADRVICFRPQAHLIRHRHKIVWFIHHIRAFYDCWDTPYGYQDNARHRGLRDLLHQTDTAALHEARTVFTNSKVVSTRLAEFNNINSEVLYPPVLQPERFYCGDFSNDIVCVCRLEHHKRQHLLIEAMRYVTTPVRLRLFGASSSAEYPVELRDRIVRSKLEDKVELNEGWLTEEDKISAIAHSLATAYIPFDEDSYGYPALESAHALKPVLTTSDSGGVLELITDGLNGYVVPPTPQALAVAIDRFHNNRDQTIAMGKNANDRLDDLNISWSHVLKRLLA